MLNTACVTHWAQFLQYLGLGLMIGGMLALGAFTAPVLFKMFPRPEAGEAMTLIFRRYDTVLIIALVMVVLGQVLSWLVNGCPFAHLGQLGIAGWVRLVVFLALTVTMAYGTLVVSPKMGEMQTLENFHTDAAIQQEFRQLHTQSEKVYKFGLLLAVLMMFSLSFAGGGGCPVGFAGGLSGTEPVSPEGM